MIAKPVVAVTKETFKAQVLEAELPVLVQFWATWCAPCRMVTPIVEQIAAEHGEFLDVVKVDVDEEPDLAAQHGAFSVPAFVVYVDGEVKQGWVGAAPKRTLEAKLSSYLPSN